MSNKYIISSNGDFYSVNELCHHGVKGMKWGVRKDKYKQMTRKQRRQLQDDHFRTEQGKADLKRIQKNTAIGTVLAGPIGGLIAGFSTMKKVSEAVPSAEAMTAAKATVNKHADKKVSELTNTAGNKPSGEKVTNLNKALKSNKPYHSLSESERNSISRSYSDRKSSLTAKWKSEKDPVKKESLLKQIDELENDYLYVIERY